jgi:hypothetical protein
MLIYIHILSNETMLFSLSLTLYYRSSSCAYIMNNLKEIIFILDVLKIAAWTGSILPRLVKLKLLVISRLYNSKETCKHLKFLISWKLHSRVKSLSALRYFPISFILNRIFLKHSPEIFSYLTVLEYSPLAEVLITMYCNISILVLSNFYLQQF